MLSEVAWLVGRELDVEEKRRTEVLTSEAAGWAAGPLSRSRQGAGRIRRGVG